MDFIRKFEKQIDSNESGIVRVHPPLVTSKTRVLHAGAIGTFTRFYPHMQMRYDYGCMLFVATFSLVSVSGDKYLDLDKQRISTIMVSVGTVMIISLLICPVWAGEDLHNLVTTNLEKLASFLEGPWIS